MKREVVFIAGFFLVIFLVGFVESADKPVCNVSSGATLRTVFGNDMQLMKDSVVLKLDGGSSTSVPGWDTKLNAHASKYDGVMDVVDTEYYLFCDLRASDSPTGIVARVCNGNNAILNLSATTNAHAQVVDGIVNYPVQICYSDLNCSSTTDYCSSAPQQNEEGIISLSGNTNAHIGYSTADESTAYNLKICCELPETEPPLATDPKAYWASSENGDEIREADVGDSVWLVFQNSQFDEGTDLIFEIREFDGTNSVWIKNVTAVVDSTENASASWIITEEDVLKALDPFDESYDAFVFFVNGNRSQNNLAINFDDSDIAFTCTDKTGGGREICENSDDDIGVFPGIYEQYEGDCEMRFNGNGCRWFEGGCVQNTSQEFNPGNDEDCDESLMYCSYTETKIPEEGCDNAEIGVYEISYNKTADSNEDCPDVDSLIVPCTARARLPFFGVYAFIITAIIIAIIYWEMNHNKSLKGKKRK